MGKNGQTEGQRKDGDTRALGESLTAATSAWNTRRTPVTKTYSLVARPSKAGAGGRMTLIHRKDDIWARLLQFLLVKNSLARLHQFQLQSRQVAPVPVGQNQSNQAAPIPATIKMSSQVTPVPATLKNNLAKLPQFLLVKNSIARLLQFLLVKNNLARLHQIQLQSNSLAKLLQFLLQSKTVYSNYAVPIRQKQSTVAMLFQFIKNSLARLLQFLLVKNSLARLLQFLLVKNSLTMLLQFLLQTKTVLLGCSSQKQQLGCSSSCYRQVQFYCSSSCQLKQSYQAAPVRASVINSLARLLLVINALSLRTKVQTKNFNFTRNSSIAVNDVVEW